MRNERRRTKRRALVNQTVRRANKARKQHGLCECGVDTRRYESEAEADSFAPAEVCDKCGKQKLRIAYIEVGPTTSEDDRITVWRGKEKIDG
jgi:hypothetical protein